MAPEDEAPHPVWALLGALLAGGSGLALLFTDSGWAWYGVAVGVAWMLITARGGLR